MKQCPLCRKPVANGGAFCVYFGKVRCCNDCDNKIVAILLISIILLPLIITGLIL